MGGHMHDFKLINESVLSVFTGKNIMFTAFVVLLIVAFVFLYKTFSDMFLTWVKLGASFIFVFVAIFLLVFSFRHYGTSSEYQSIFKVKDIEKNHVVFDYKGKDARIDKDALKTDNRINKGDIVGVKVTVPNHYAKYNDDGKLTFKNFETIMKDSNGIKINISSKS